MSVSSLYSISYSILKMQQEFASSNSSLSLPRKWQVFFLPKSDIQDSPSTSIIAFCPFTKIWVEGKDISEATRNWLIEARRRLNCGFYIPKSCHRSKKVWYGCSGANLDLPVFIVPNLNEENSSSEIFNAVAFCPQTGQVISGNIDEWKMESNSDKLKFLPNFWMDSKVLCTPIITCGGETQTPISHSLTPHCIN